MAIDTPAKRSSAINVGSPWRSRLPFPDGTIGQGDRQAAAFLYSGILAASVAVTATRNLIMPVEPRQTVFEIRERLTLIPVAERQTSFEIRERD